MKLEETKEYIDIIDFMRDKSYTFQTRTFSHLFFVKRVNGKIIDAEIDISNITKPTIILEYNQLRYLFSIKGREIPLNHKDFNDFENYLIKTIEKL